MTMLTLTQEALRAKNCLKTHHIVVPDEWISACIEFLHEECGGQAIPQENLNESVYEQWLNSDLHTLQSSCLPGNLVEKRKIILNGHFVLQVDEVIDVSQPAYQQLCKLRGARNENMFVSADPPAKKEPKLSRMLMLKLTDGSQTIQGMEYRTLPMLDVDTKPGSKILVHGQVPCREGVLLLTKEVVTILGGEVDSLKETSMPIQVLARTLGQEDALGQVDPPQVPNVTAQTIATAVVNHTAMQPSPRRTVQADPECKRIRLATNTNGRQRLQTNENGSSAAEPITINDDSNSGFPDDDDLFPDAAEFDWPGEEMEIDENEDFQNEIRSDSPVFQSSANVPSCVDKPKNSFSTLTNSSLQANSNNGTSAAQSVNNATKKNAMQNGSALKRPSLTLSKSKVDSASKNKLTSKTLNDFFTPKTGLNAPVSSVLSNRTANSRRPALSDFPSDDWDDDFEVACQELDESVFSNKNQSNISKAPNATPSQTQLSTGTDILASERRLLKLGKKTDTSASDTSESDLMRPYSSNSVVVIDDEDDNVDDFISERSPYTTIFEIKRQLSATFTGTFVIRGFIAAIVSGLKPTDSGWNLPVKINDGTGQMDAILTNQLLEPMIGHKARDKQELKALAKENPQYKEELKGAAINCQVKLMNLCALLELTLSPNEKPSVTSYRPVTARNLSTLQNPTRLAPS